MIARLFDSLIYRKSSMMGVKVIKAASPSVKRVESYIHLLTDLVKSVHES